MKLKRKTIFVAVLIHQYLKLSKKSIIEMYLKEFL